METRERAWLLRMVAPLLVLGAAWVLWMVSDRLLFIGPLDRAAFGWIVVVPLLVLAVPVAGYSWRASPGRMRIVGSIALGASVAVVLGVINGLAFQPGACPTGDRLTATDAWLIGAGIGLAGGAAYGAAAFVAASIPTSSTMTTLAKWIAFGVAASAVALIAFINAIPLGGCNRPI